MPRVRFALASLAVLAAFLIIACAGLNHPDPVSLDVESSRAAVSKASESDLTVVTFNVHMESPKKLIAAIMSDRDLRAADIILLQEIEWPSGAARSNAAAIAHALRMDHAYAPGYGLKGGGSHGLAILSRIALREIRAIELPKIHTVVNSGRRVALAATVDHSGNAVRLWNVHLDNRVNPRERLGQLSPVFQAIKTERYDRVVLAGDLNTSPFCWGGHLVPLPCFVQARKLEKAARKHGFDLPTRTAGATHKFIGMRLDAIYVRGLETEDVGVAKTRISDHFPLWARIAI